MSVSNQCSVLAGMFGFTLPITTTTLQAMVTNYIKPGAGSPVVSASIHAYVIKAIAGKS